MRPPVGYDAGAMSREDREHWEAAHGTTAASPAQTEPAPFLVQHAGLLRPGVALDVAAGAGPNAATSPALGCSAPGRPTRASRACRWTSMRRASVRGRSTR